MSLTGLNATQLREKLLAGEVSSEAVTRAFATRIEQFDSQTGAFLRFDPDVAISRARQLDKRRSAGEDIGLLAGLPVAVKDVLCTQGEITSCASRMLENYRPPYNATVVEKIEAAGGVILGKTNMDEFAMGGSTENSGFQPTRNPWDVSRTPGGSSGGAAAAVAASLAPLSIGTDTGGSIRQPAGLCGVVGMKPTYGRVSRYGLIAFASSLDQVGPLAHTAEDTALLLQVIAGHDGRDSTSANAPTPAYFDSVTKPLEGLKLGLVEEHFGDGLDAEVETAVREAIKVYESLGATVEMVSLPHQKYGIATYYIIAPCEASSNLARFDGTHYGHRTQENLQTIAAEDGVPDESPLVTMYRQSRAEGFGPEVKRRIMLGNYALSSGYYDAYYLKALKVRRLIRNDYDEVFKKVDLLAGPVSPTPAFPLGEKTGDPLSMYLVDLYTVGANLAGNCGISLPCGFSSGGLPIGLQLQGPPLAEERLLQASYMFQQATNWHERRPEL